MTVRNKSPFDVHVALFTNHDNKKDGLILKINMIVKKLNEKLKSC